MWHFVTISFSSNDLSCNIGEEFWKDLVQNPDKWYDNRSRKVTYLKTLVSNVHFDIPQ